MTNLVLDTDLDPLQRDYIRTIKSSAESLFGIVNNVLDLSKIEAGKLDLESIPFTIGEVVSQVIEPFALSANEKHVELLCDINPRVPASVVGDPTLLRQVLGNLIGNALKFTEVGHVLLSVTPEDHREGTALLHFRVRDTGIGIPGEKQSAIFDAFSQAEGSTTRRFGGTGLGLTISATLVHMMGGRIWVESEPGVGSTFHFTARFDTASAEHEPRRLPSATASRGDSGRGTSAKILVAEDNVVNQRVAAGLLTKRGHHITIVTNGRDAVAATEREMFDLVLMDVEMPIMGGLEATRAIREREIETGAHLRIVAMTAHAMTRDRERCYAAGMDGFLSKPIEPEQLFGAVEQRAADDALATPPSPLDRTRLLATLAGDEALMADIVRVSLDDCPVVLNSLKTAVARKEITAIQRSAHTLKGIAGHLSASALSDAAAALERIAAEGRPDGVDAAWRRVEAEAALLLDALRRMNETEEASACSS
jgi:CheY-like chemotaxis protein